MRPASIVERLRGALLGVPVFLKVMGLAMGLTALMATGLLWEIHETWHRKLLLDLTERGELLGVDLALHGKDLVLAGRLDELQRLLDEARERFPDVEYVVAQDARGAVLAGSFQGAPEPSLLASNGLAPGGRAHAAALRTLSGGVRDVAVPILAGKAGVMRVGMSEGRILEEVNWLARRLALVTGIIAVLALAAAWFLAAILTRPLDELVRLARAVKEGHYSARAPVRARDEVGELATAFNEMTTALVQKEAARQQLMRQVLAAAEGERRRVARELHDQTGQALVSLIAGFGALEGAGRLPEQTTRLSELRQIAEQTLAEVHDLSRTLRPAALDELGLVSALQRHCEAFGSRLGLIAECEVVGLNVGMRLPDEVEVAVYRIVQEALTNATRHGRARSVHVLLQRRDGALLAVIEDDGRGFDTSEWRATSRHQRRMGLLGIEERAALLGGTLRIESHPGAGTRLFVDIPLVQERVSEEDSSPHRG